jgi:hypothetical protein
MTDDYLPDHAQLDQALMQLGVHDPFQRLAYLSFGNHFSHPSSQFDIRYPDGCEALAIAIGSQAHRWISM